MNFSSTDSELLTPKYSTPVISTSLFQGENSPNQSLWTGADVPKIVDEKYIPLESSRRNPNIQFTPVTYEPLFNRKRTNDLEATLRKEDFQIQIGEDVFDLAFSNEHTPCGEFYVTEKWINPFWKSQTRFWVPGKHNPLGRYLIILADEFGNKIPQGIHQWVQWEYSCPNFKQGNFGSGCLRTKIEDMEKIYKALPLGSKIKIK